MIPRVKTICRIPGITRDQAVSIRYAMYQYDTWQRCPTPMSGRPAISTVSGVMQRIDEVLNGNGVECIPQGSNKRSPSITYVNMGDTYDTTVMYVRGRFLIGAWGDIVERGNYA